MAKHIIQILGTIVMFAAIINGINGQCTASDLCCAPISGNGDWAKPEGARDAFARCYIQGTDVNSTDCPTGWEYQAGNTQCQYVPFQPDTFASVKSCSDSNSCSSVENLCGNPTVRSGLNLNVNCVIEGTVNITSCPKGWSRESCSKCVKTIQGTNYNATRTEDTSTCNPTIMPDYSVVCENPQTYNKNNIITQWSVSCQDAIIAVSATGGCLGHIDWETASYSDFANLTGTKNGLDCSTINFTQWGCCSGTPTSTTQAPTTSTNTPTNTEAPTSTTATTTQAPTTQAPTTSTNTTTQAPTTSTNTNTTTAASEDELDTSASTMTARVHYVFLLITTLGIIYWF